MRYFFAPMPAAGYVNPGLPLAKALVQRGHDVRWYSIPRFKEAIESIGARYIPFRNTTTVDEEQLDTMFPDRPAGGLNQLRYDGMLRDCEEELHREPADVIIGDDASAFVEALHAKLGIPWAVYGITDQSARPFPTYFRHPPTMRRAYFAARVSTP